MATRQYIGARYIPKFADPVEWDATKAYEYLTMVQHVGETYMSKQNVPVGAPLPDISQNEESTEYWVHMSNWNAQVEAYRQEVLQYNDRIATLENDLPISDFDSTDTVKKAIDEVSNIIPVSSFSSLHTVEDELSNRILYFNTVADMKSASHLSAGYVARTKGFTSINDGGAAWYVIENTGTANDMDVIACQNSLYAKYLPDDGKLYPEQFGAVAGDSDFDNTSILQHAIDYTVTNNMTLVFFQKSYYIDDTLEITNSYTHIESDNYNVRGITKPNLIITHANKPIFSILGDAVDVEFGGTLENVTIKRIGMDRSVSAGASSCGIRIRYAQFVYLDQISISHSCHDIEFANFNGLHITNSVLSNDTAHNGACFYKTNDEGSTGLELQNIVYYTEIASKFLYHRTDTSQSGDIVIDNVEIAGPVSNIVDLQANSGFACHTFFNKISADNLTSQAFYIHNSSQNMSQSIIINDVWVLGTGTGSGICDITNAMNIQFSNITLGCNANMDNPILLSNAKGVTFNNIHFTRGSSTTNTRVAQFSNGSTGCIINNLHNATSGAIWISSGCDKNIITNCVLTESVQNAGTDNIVDNNITNF